MQAMTWWRQAELVYHNPERPILMTRNAPDGRHLEYLTDWTAVINAGKKAGIEWEKSCLIKNVRPSLYSGPETGDKYSAWFNEEKIICRQQPNWSDCAALMIVMIEVMENTK
jgi:hypothetical protein